MKMYRRNYEDNEGEEIKEDMISIKFNAKKKGKEKGKLIGTINITIRPDNVIEINNESGTLAIYPRAGNCIKIKPERF